MHLYLHIPFCKQACHYCDFHFSTSQKNRNDVLRAMMQELELRKEELPGNILQTVYFGGGTPSLLVADELKFVFDAIARHFEIAGDAEITLEANPDDLSENYLQQLRATPVNRLSIGIQSFRDEDLQMMNRAHTSSEALACVQRAQDKGFDNITIDLIYGIPGLSESDWHKNLDRAFALHVRHLSAYCLTVEPRTALAQFVKAGKIQPVDEVLAAAHFLSLVQRARENGFEQYEISNFAKENFIAKHNSSYWFGEPYLGIGPSAHSYDGKSLRKKNVPNNALYMKAVESGKEFYEREELSEKEKFNEFVLTRLRTKWGISNAELNRKFDENFSSRFESNAGKWIKTGEMIFANGIFSLSEDGKLLADRIASDLFVV